MTRKVFLKCCELLHNKKTTFIGGKIYMNSGREYSKVVRLEFDKDSDSVCAFYMDTEHRKRVQDRAQAWVELGHNLIDFEYPLNIVTLDRKNIRKIFYPKKVIQLLLTI